MKFGAYDLICGRFFKESSLEEREHAEKLMEYQVFDDFNQFYFVSIARS